MITSEAIEKNFIHKRWYNLNDEGTYKLSLEFRNMLHLGYIEIFKVTNGIGALPYQRFGFYCVDNNGNLKLFSKNIGPIDDLSLNSLLNMIEKECLSLNLKFVCLTSDKYKWHYIEDFLGEDLKYEMSEIDNKKYIKLFY